MTDSLPRHSVLGVQFHAVTRREAVERILLAARQREALGVSALAVHGLMVAFDDPEYRYRINDLELVVPDGHPVRWALNWLYQTSLSDRVMGPELMWDLCVELERGLPVFLFGSNHHTLDRLTENLKTSFPHLVIAGTQSSRFRNATAEEAAADVSTIRGSGARITFAGLGCPRQEIWAWENRHNLGMPVIAVGAAFDYHAGLIRRAPAWMAQSGLEWVYRLLQEPKRLWRRYAATNPRYLYHLALQVMGRTYTSEGTAPVQPVRPG